MLGVTLPASMSSVSRSRSLARSLQTSLVSRWPTNERQDRGPAAAGPCPPVQLPPSSPPTMTAVPCGVSARRRRAERRVAGDVEDQVVAAGAVGEVVTGVVDDVVGTEGAHQVELRGAAHAGDLRPERLGQLHGVAADAPGGADDQHLLPCLDPADVGQRLQRGEPAETGTTAACSKVRLAGLRASLSSRATAYSANEPGAIPNTSSPDREPGHRRRRPRRPCRRRRARAPGSSGRGTRSPRRIR